MHELPIFISYRRDDGVDLALWLREALLGRILRGSFEFSPAVLSPYLDLASPAVSDWQSLHMRELQHARALLVICTPGSACELDGGKDWLYHELRWWLANRKMAPILVAYKNHGTRYIPAPIKSRWPNAAVTLVDLSLFKSETQELDEPACKVCVDSLLGGIACSAGGGSVRHKVDGWTVGALATLPGIFTWEKDSYYRYISANESYARAAGYDSPEAMIGKTDDDMPWNSLADFFRLGDYQVMTGTGESRECVPEKEIMVDRVADILVTEGPLLVRGKCVGVTGCFIDITGRQLLPQPSPSLLPGASLPLGKEFGNTELTYAEVAVFRGMVRNQPAEMIAKVLGFERSAVEIVMKSLRHKLQCGDNGDVIATAVRAGLPLALFGPGVEC